VRVTIITIGSRGDVQPHVALGMGLHAAGHEVTVATHPRFGSLLAGLPLTFAPVVEGAVSRGSETEEGRRWAEKDSRKLPAWVGFLRDGKSVAHRRLADALEACDDAEAIVVSAPATLLGYQLAELKGVPLVRAYAAPLGAAFAAGADPSATQKLGAKIGGSAVRQAMWLCARPWVNAARRDVLSLPPLPVREFYDTFDRRRVPLLYGFSPAVFAPEGLGDWVHVTGYWFLDAPTAWEPPARLIEFLAEGPPPVFVGFGTMIDGDPKATTAVVVDALARAGQRGILQVQGGVQDGDLPRDVLAIDDVLHDWLFARVAAAVHHGGAGTTGTALRAGLPSVLVPFFADQPFWARRVHELGVGPPAIPRKRLSAERLAQAIRIAATDPRMRERAQALAEHIGAEDGVARAVDAIERHVANGSGESTSTTRRAGIRA
jgi:UDP:flavonoid glycosyltransferase YjiC (YdhE family)